MSNNELHEFFHAKEVAEIATMGAVATLKTTDTVEKAVSLMSKNNILSVPVVDATGTCVGIVDTLDVVSFVLSVAPDKKSLDENQLRSLEISGRAMAFKQVSEVVGLSGRDPYVPVFLKNPASQVVDMFARGLHRAPVFDDSNAIVGTVSQSSVVRVLAANLHMGHLKVVGALGIRELGLGQVAPVTVSKNDTVLAALSTIQENNVSAVAVLDDDGKLFGNFSGTDIKALYTEHWPSFLLSVEDFLNKHSEKSLTPVVCQPESTFLTVCQEMAQSKVHRLWVVDGDYKPVGLVSATDINKVCRDATAHV